MTEQQVFTSDGRRGWIVGETSQTRDDPRFVDVQIEDGALLHVPVELLELRPDGAFTLRVGAHELDGQSAATSGATLGERRLVVPVLAEELAIDRRVVTTGVVRVEKRVHEREELVDTAVTREHVQVDRVPVGQFVDAPPAIRHEGETLVIPVLEEVLVVEKRLRLKEEIRVTRQRVTEPAPERVVLRFEEVVVERLPVQGNDADRSTSSV